MYERMDEWESEWMNGRVNEWMDERFSRRITEQTFSNDDLYISTHFFRRSGFLSLKSEPTMSSKYNIFNI